MDANIMSLDISVPEKTDEHHIYDRQKNFVEPFWRDKVSQGVFGGLGSIDIAYAYAVHPNPIGSIALSSGRIETLLKYKELVFNLYNAGYSVFIHDHRGQGLSGRMTDDAHQGYVEKFDDYVQDFKIFYDKVISPKSVHTPMLLCHSMGGAIGALYVLAHPTDFSKVVFSAPMFGIRPALPNWFAATLLKIHHCINAIFSDKPWYFFGQNDYSDEPFENNRLTRSHARYSIFREAYRNQSEVQLGGVTGVWLKAASHAMNRIESEATAFSIPSLLLQAGNDTVVDNVRQNNVAEKLPDCQKILLLGAKHELLFELDNERDTCLRAILQFFK
jgi:lysophospholipase